MMDEIERVKETQVALEIAKAEHLEATEALKETLDNIPELLAQEDLLDRVVDLARSWGPRMLTYLGLPGAGLLAAIGTSDDGAFSGLTDILGNIGGFLF